VGKPIFVIFSAVTTRDRIFSANISDRANSMFKHVCWALLNVTKILLSRFLLAVLISFPDNMTSSQHECFIFVRILKFKKKRVVDAVSGLGKLQLKQIGGYLRKIALLVCPYPSASTVIRNEISKLFYSAEFDIRT
jgi:hypothetical protein